MYKYRKLLLLQQLTVLTSGRAVRDVAVESCQMPVDCPRTPSRWSNPLILDLYLRFCILDVVLMYFSC